MTTPAHVTIIGAGMVGLCTAWFLQERGVEVTILDRTGVAAGSSWGNAGWIAPALTLPLPEPSIFRFGVKAIVSPSSPVYVPLAANTTLLRFLAGFARHSLPGMWRKNMTTFAEINKWGLDSFDRMEDGGVASALTHADPFLAAFVNERDRQTIVHEFDEVAARGGHVSFTKITGDELREIEPSVSGIVTHGLRIEGQRFINPPAFMEVLAASVRARGARIIDGANVTGVRDLGTDGIAVDVDGQDAVRSDQVVIATGTWLSGLARQFGVRQVVQAGRGYSFSVKPPVIPTHPIYLAAQRVACTPLGDRLRVGGMMEFRRADAPADPRRIHVTDWSREGYTSPRVPSPRASTATYGHPLFQQAVAGRIHWASTETATDYAGHIEGAIRAGTQAARSIALLAAVSTPRTGQAAAPSARPTRDDRQERSCTN